MGAISVADLEQKFLKTADLLRNNGIAASEYSDIIFAMLLLKWASDQPGQLDVPERAHWNQVVERGDRFPGEALNEALAALRDSNHEILDDLFLNLDFTRKLSRSPTHKLISHFNDISLAPANLRFEDVVAQACDYLLGAFTDGPAKTGGHFYTPRSVIQLMVRLADPRPGHSVYDPFAGSAGMLTCADEYVREHSGRHGELNLFGQEKNVAMCGTARLNLLFHGTPHASIRCGDTLSDPLHVTDDGRLRSFDRILTNPPFSMSYRRDEVRFPERMRYGWTPETGKKADLMFVQHVLATLAPGGVGVIVTPHGVLFRGGSEAEIRRGIVLEDRLEAVIGIGPNVFHGTSVPACILVLRGNGKALQEKHDVLFINAEHEITTGRSRNYLDPRHVEKIATTFHGRREIPHFSRVVMTDEIASNDFNLNIRHYIDPKPATVRLDYQALLLGGVPRGEVEAQRNRFQAFGIDITELFTSGEPERLEFRQEDCEAIAERIPVWAATSEHRFLDQLRDWLESKRVTLANLDARALPAARRDLMESFRRQLLPLAILDDHQLVGVFADWWAAHHDDFRELSGGFPRQGAGGPDVVNQPRETILNALEQDLTARVKKLVALERQRLIDTYRSWSDRYGTSLLDLENKCATSTARLGSHLRKLGYPWLGGR